MLRSRHRSSGYRIASARALSAVLLTCACLSPAATARAQSIPNAPCVPVPVVDDRCEEWVSFDTGSPRPDGFDFWGFRPDIAASPDGQRVYVTTVHREGSDFSMLTSAKEAASGSALWTRTYDVPDRTDVPDDIAVSPSGDSVAVTGRSDTHVNEADGMMVSKLTTILYGEDGAVRWVSTFDGAPGEIEGHTVRFSPDGMTVYVAGSAGDGATVILLALDAANGSVRWSVVREIDPTESLACGVLDCMALGVAPDGSSVFLGVTEGATLDTVVPNELMGTHLASGAIATYAYDASGRDAGRLRWMSRYAEGRGNRLADLEVSPDGTRVVVTGTTQVDMKRGDAVTIAYDAGSGTQAWLHRFDGQSGGPDEAAALDISPDGTLVAMSGMSSTHKVADEERDVRLDYDPFVTVIDAATGTGGWTHTRPNPNFQHSTDVAFSTDGTRLVTSEGSATLAGPIFAAVPICTQMGCIVPGSSFTFGTGDYQTLGLSAATGATEWVARFGSPGGFSIPNEIVASEGRVYVAGSWTSALNGLHPASRSDVATLAYQT